MDELRKKIDDVETQAIHRIQQLDLPNDVIYIVQDMTTAILKAINQHKGKKQ